MAPKKSHFEVSAAKSTGEPPKISRVEEEKLMAFMRQVGDTSTANLQDRHIDEVLSQRRQITEYIHEENMQEHERFKIIQDNTLRQIIIFTVFATTVLIIVAIVDKAYLPTAVTALLSFLGGVGIGKGISRESALKK